MLDNLLRGDRMCLYHLRNIIKGFSVSSDIRERVDIHPEQGLCFNHGALFTVVRVPTQWLLEKQPTPTQHLMSAFIIYIYYGMT